MQYEGRHVLQWHITHRCNLRCAHCYQDDFTASMPREVLFSALEDYAAFLEKHALLGQINLTGGEPLLHPDFAELAQAIRKKGIALGILTNGTVITEAWAEFLEKLQPVFIQVSLDGPEKVHDTIRGKGSFDRAMLGIDALKRHGLPVHVSFTAQRDNYRRLTGLALVCRLHKVDKLWFDRVVIPKEEDKDGLSLTADQFALLLKTAGRLNRFGLVSGSRALQFQTCRKGRCYHCGAGGNLLILLADGSVMPCRRLPFVIGNIRESSLEEIVSGSEMMKELREAPVPEACRSCRYAESCRGGARCIAMAKTGLWNSKDPDCKVR